jgi:hypothetical protein
VILVIIRSCTNIIISVFIQPQTTASNCQVRFRMSAEYPRKYKWWLNELDSLGISTLQKNGLGNQKGASDLTGAVKQTLYEEYLQAYSESNL